MPSPFIKELFMQGLKIDPKRTRDLKKTTKFTGEISQRRFKTFFLLKMTLSEMFSVLVCLSLLFVPCLQMQI